MSGSVRAAPDGAWRDDGTLALHETWPDEAARAIGDGLDAANDAAAPLHEVRPLAVVARDAEGAVVGGALGRTWGACAELQQLWVTPARRRHGLGARLVRAFEQGAAARGCTQAYLETFSFQAPSLYRALGYDVRLSIEGFAPGVVKHVMVHVLDRPG